MTSIACDDDLDSASSPDPLVWNFREPHLQPPDWNQFCTPLTNLGQFDILLNVSTGAVQCNAMS